MSGDDAGALTAYGAALGPLVNMALRPLQGAQPQCYAALMHALARGELRLHLLNVIGFGGAPSCLVLSAVDSVGAATQLATLNLDSGILN